MEINLEFISNEATKLELALLGVANATSDSRAAQRLADWQSHGLNGGMEYMARDSKALSDPSTLLPGVRSVITVAVNYDAPPKERELPRHIGRVARYAAGEDYHHVLKNKLEALVERLDFYSQGGAVSRVVVDSAPIMERALAEKAGLGFVGKNTMIIRPKIGSFFLLGEIFTTLELEETPPLITTGCRGCSTCRIGCPTGALDKEYSLDARRCISYLTIEKKGVLTEWERQAIGGWIFGCDICQEICPFNHVALKEGRLARINSLRGSSGVGYTLDLREVLAIREEASFRARFGATPLMRARRAGLLRNAAIVAANNMAGECLTQLLDCVENDRSPTVRRHAAWSLVKLFKAGVGPTINNLKMVLERLVRDNDSGVAQEAGELWLQAER